MSQNILLNCFISVEGIVMKISEEQFNILYNDYSQELFNIAYGFTKNEDDSNDLVQDTFLKLLLLNKDFKSNLDIKYYLIRIIINKSKNYLKSYNKTKVIKNEDIINIYPHDSNQKYNEIEYSIEKLPSNYKIVIFLKYYNQMNSKEIASILNITEATVRKRLDRARRLLKQLIKESEKNG